MLISLHACATKHTSTCSAQTHVQPHVWYMWTRGSVVVQHVVVHASVCTCVICTTLYNHRHRKMTCGCVIVQHVVVHVSVCTCLCGCTFFLCLWLYKCTTTQSHVDITKCLQPNTQTHVQPHTHMSTSHTSTHPHVPNPHMCGVTSVCALNLARALSLCPKSVP